MAVPVPLYSFIPSVFSRVHVSYAVVGGARISWELGRGFDEPMPYTFQLQIGRQGLSNYRADGAGRTDDWVNVGATVVDTFFTTDPERRLYGKTADVHYRVKLTTALGTVYYSDPVNLYGDLGKHDWLTVQDIVRKENLRNRRQVGVAGLLLKAYRYGPPCPVCLDPVTGEVTNAHCLTCYNTGFLGGYFAPFDSFYGVLSGESSREALNPRTNMGKPVTVSARMLAEPQVYAMDVFVEKDSDLRYYIHPTNEAAQHRSVPVVMEVELRLAPYSDVVYQVPLV